MDINDMLQREQIERMRADRSACTEARAAHIALADGYRGALNRYRLAAVSKAGLAPGLLPLTV